MKIFLALLLFPALAFANYGGSARYPDTNCVGGLTTLYIDGVAQTPKYSQDHTALVAVIKFSQEFPDKTIVLKKPDITCTTIWKSIASVSSSSVSSFSSSVASSSACPATAIVPYFRVGGTVWHPGDVITVAANTQVELGPQPYTGSWSWSGCGYTGAVREQTVRTTVNCKIIATHTNTCGAKSTHEYSINIGSVSSSSASSSSAQQSSSPNLTVTWEHPGEREDGSVLTREEIAGYEIRQWSNSSFTSIKIGVVTSVVIPLTDEKIEVAVFDTEGLYSDFVEAK